jgi:superfamily II DNA or RNA helicase
VPPVVEQELKPLPAWLKLRDVQVVMFKNLATSYRKGYRKQGVMASTAAGKTYFAAVLFHKMLTKKPDSRLIFIVPRNTLIQQAMDDFQQILDMPIGVIQGQDERLDLSLPVQIATIQTLGRRIEAYPDLFGKLHFDLAVIDEFHIRFQAIEKISASWITGLSATPYSKGLGLFYDDLVKSIPARELVEQGVITPIRVFSAKRQIDTTKLGTASTGEYVAADEELEAAQIIGDVVREYENNPDMKGRPVIGFARSISTCISLAEAFCAAGHKFGYVHSKMSDKDNEAVLTAFKSDILIGVFSVVKLVEGFNFPEASALLLCTSFAPSKNDPNTPNALNRYVQMIGRVRRSVEGDPDKYALIHDHGQNYIKYGHPDLFEIGFDKLDDGKKADPNDEEKTEKDIKAKVCPECSAYVDKGNVCDCCGHKFEKHTELVDGEIVEFINGKMVEVEPSPVRANVAVRKKEWTKEEKQAMYSGFIYAAREKRLEGKSYKGFIAWKYREIFDVWPRSLEHVSAYNSDASAYVKIKDLEWKRKQRRAKK